MDLLCRVYLPVERDPGVSYPLANEMSHRADRRLTLTVADFLQNLGRAMARAILVTMSHNFVSKVWYSSLVMRQVSWRRLEGIRARPEVNTLLGSAA